MRFTRWRALPHHGPHMSAEAAIRAEAEAARPPLDLSSPLFAVAVGALVPLFRILQILRDMLARNATPGCCLKFVPLLLGVAVAWGAYTPLIFWLGRRFPPSTLRNVPVHFGAVIALAMPIEIFWWYFGSPAMHKPPPDPFGPYVLFRLANAIVPYALILGAGVLRDRHVEQSRYARLMLRLEKQLAETELASLRMHLDPQLLSATLEAIDDACRKDDERAERLVVALADFLRITLDQIDRRDTTLARELARLEPLAVVLSELSGRAIALDISVSDADARTLASPPALATVARELLAATKGDVTLRVVVDGQVIVECVAQEGTVVRRLDVVPAIAVQNIAESLPPMPVQPFAMPAWLAFVLLLLASLFARATMEIGATRDLDFAYWSGIGALLTVPGCIFSVWIARRMVGSARVSWMLFVIFVATFAAAFVSELAYAFVYPRWDQLNSVAAMRGFLPAVARSRGVAFHHILFVVLAFFAMAVRYDERARDVLALQARVREAHLRKLRAQLRPHFLFNSLNSILGRLGRDREAAAAMATSIRRFLQTTFEREPRDAVALSEELAAIREYLDIERNRVGARLHVEWRIDENARDARVPTLLLQPLVENAIQHGVANVSRPVTVTVSAKRNGRSVMLAVEDDGAGASASRGHGLGLTTTRGLLAAFYGDDAQLSAGPRQPHGYAVRMNVPLR